MNGCQSNSSVTGMATSLSKTSQDYSVVIRVANAIVRDPVTGTTGLPGDSPTVYMTTQPSLPQEARRDPHLGSRRAPLHAGSVSANPLNPVLEQ